MRRCTERRASDTQPVGEKEPERTVRRDDRGDRGRRNRADRQIDHCRDDARERAVEHELRRQRSRHPPTKQGADDEAGRGNRDEKGRVIARRVLSARSERIRHKTEQRDRRDDQHPLQQHGTERNSAPPDRAGRCHVVLWCDCCVGHVVWLLQHSIVPRGWTTLGRQRTSTRLAGEATLRRSRETARVSRQRGRSDKLRATLGDDLHGFSDDRRRTHHFRVRRAVLVCAGWWFLNRSAHFDLLVHVRRKF